MGKYIIAYIVTIVGTLAIMFCMGCVIGMFGILISTSQQELQASLQGGVLQLVVQVISLFVGFFCFRYSVRRFVEND
jgi:membrane protein YdbS with pleckstrin-like domain|tara:strand:+ start:4467 stop:4697 length:231 start_codon:yes stop_codon:yes gene_type:complete